MNKEINSISESIQQTTKLVRRLPIDNKLKHELITDLFLSYVNVQEIGELI